MIDHSSFVSKRVYRVPTLRTYTTPAVEFPARWCALQARQPSRAPDTPHYRVQMAWAACCRFLGHADIAAALFSDSNTVAEGYHQIAALHSVAAAQTLLPHLYILWAGFFFARPQLLAFAKTHMAGTQWIGHGIRGRGACMRCPAVLLASVLWGWNGHQTKAAGTLGLSRLTVANQLNKAQRGSALADPMLPIQVAREVTPEAIAEAMRKHHGFISRAARDLGFNACTLWRHLQSAPPGSVLADPTLRRPPKFKPLLAAENIRRVLEATDGDIDAASRQLGILPNRLRGLLKRMAAAEGAQHETAAE